MIDFHYWPTPNGWKVSTKADQLHERLGQRVERALRSEPCEVVVEVLEVR